jgi:hypothetical protein
MLHVRSMEELGVSGNTDAKPAFQRCDQLPQVVLLVIEVDGPHAECVGNVQIFRRVVYENTFAGRDI